MKSWEDNFREYLRKYCESRNVLLEEAIKHKMVQEVKECYQKDGVKEEFNLINSTWTESGCCK